MKFSELKNKFQCNPKKIASSFKTRSFHVGGYSVLVTTIVLAIAVAANLLVRALPSGATQFDTTSSQLFSISEQTENIVKRLEENITIYWIVQSGEEDSTVETLLNRYESMSDRITVEKKDPDIYPTFVQQYVSGDVYNNSLIVEAGDRYRYISYEEIYVYDYTNYYYDGTYDVSFDGESALTSAIDYIMSENLPKLYVMTGHGESSLTTTFQSAIEKENIEPAELSLVTLEAIPDDADCILIYAPQSDISEQEQEMLLSYLQSGGNLMLITSSPQDGALANLGAVMEYYGVTASEGIVIEGSQSNYAYGRPYYLLPDRISHTITSPLLENGYYVLLPVAQGLNVSTALRDSVTVSELLTTSDSAFSKIAGYNFSTYEKEEGDIDGPFSLAVAITETLEDESETNIVWVSSAALLDDQINTEVSGGNQDFFLNCLSWMCEQDESSISIHAKNMSYEYLTMSSRTSSLLTILMIGIIPLAYLGIGIYIWIRRKHR